MRTTSDTQTDIEMACQRRGAARFFWLWLIVATAMSVTGNVADALLHAQAGTVALAAGAALVTGIARYHNDPNTFTVRRRVSKVWRSEGSQPETSGTTERALRRAASVEAQESPARNLDWPRAHKKVR
jgi:hypothetical protein